MVPLIPRAPLVQTLDLTQQAERVASFQTHADVSALLFPAQEQQELAQEILGFHHCQALKGKQTEGR